MSEPKHTAPIPTVQPEPRAPYQRPTLEYHGVYHILTGQSSGGGEGDLGFINPFKLSTNG